ncbi:GNAT family N-acetyltransferase [Streptomyces sp. NPDC054849]
MFPVTCSSERLRLRELSADDTDGLFAILGSPEATAHLSLGTQTRAGVEAIVDWYIAAARVVARADYAFAVVTRHDGGLIGLGRLSLDPQKPREAVVGLVLRQDQWGVGYGVETARMLLAFGFEVLELHRIRGERSPANEASARTMSATGMTEEGVIRNHVYQAGAWRDSVVHAIYDREWQPQGPAHPEPGRSGQPIRPRAEGGAAPCASTHESDTGFDKETLIPELRGYSSVSPRPGS